MKIQDYIVPGSFVTAIPVGLRVTLKYTVSGNLSQVFIGSHGNEKEVTSEIMLKLVDEKAVPQPIRIHGGTTTVYGILYTSETIKLDAMLPELDVLTDALYELYLKNSAQFNFFAYYIQTEAFPITNGKSVRDNLSLCGFRTLPSFLAPATISNEFVKKWAETSMKSFHHKVIPKFCVISDTAQFVNAGCSQSVVTETKKYTDSYGFVRVSLGDCSIDYSDYISFGVNIGSVLFFDSEYKMVQCDYGDDKKRDFVNVCEVCGRHYPISAHGKVLCPDDTCMSRSLEAVQNMLSRFKLPEFPNTRNYIEFIKENKIVNILDILDYPMYSDIQIHVDIATLIRAMIPISVIRSDEFFTILANGCNNTVKTLEHYLEHPDRIPIDLGIHHKDLPAFSAWIRKPANFSDITAALSHPRIHIDSVAKRFDGVPAFRNKTIYITGRFVHGSIADITAILQSYSAKVVTTFDKDVDWVIVGGKNEQSNGQAIISAKNLDIPVYDEIAFFNHYDIDSDIQLASGGVV